MNRFFPTVLLLLLLTIALTARAGEHEPDTKEFKALCDVALDMDHTTIGEAYEEHFGEAIKPDMVSALKGCAQRSKPPYVVYLVFVIAPDGKVMHVFADPDQPVSVCVAAKLSREKVPAPPKPPVQPHATDANPYWLQLINVDINQ